jgi:hypothetical protein
VQAAHRAPDYPDALGGEDLVERGGELGVPISDQQPEASEVMAHGEVPRLLGDPWALRMRRDAGEMHPAAPELEEEEDRETPQPSSTVTGCLAPPMSVATSRARASC